MATPVPPSPALSYASAVITGSPLKQSTIPTQLLEENAAQALGHAVTTALKRAEPHSPYSPRSVPTNPHPPKAANTGIDPHSLFLRRAPLGTRAPDPSRSPTPARSGSWTNSRLRGPKKQLGDEDPQSDDDRDDDQDAFAAIKPLSFASSTPAADPPLPPNQPPSPNGDEASVIKVEEEEIEIPAGEELDGVIDVDAISGDEDAEMGADETHTPPPSYSQPSTSRPTPVTPGNVFDPDAPAAAAIRARAVIARETLRARDEAEAAVRATRRAEEEARARVTAQALTRLQDERIGENIRRVDNHEAAVAMQEEEWRIVPDRRNRTILTPTARPQANFAAPAAANPLPPAAPANHAAQAPAQAPAPFLPPHNPAQQQADQEMGGPEVGEDLQVPVNASLSAVPNDGHPDLAIFGFFVTALMKSDAAPRARGNVIWNWGDTSKSDPVVRWDQLAVNLVEGLLALENADVSLIEADHKKAEAIDLGTTWGKAPGAWATVGGLTLQELRLVLSRCMWNRTNGTALAMTWPPPPVVHPIALNGLAHVKDRTVYKDRVRTKARGDISNSPKIRELAATYFDNLTDANGLPCTAENALPTLLASIDVRVSYHAESNTNEWWLKWMPPTRSMMGEYEFVMALRQMTFVVEGLGTINSTMPPLVWCGDCRGNDHTTNHCPFSKVEGFQAPPAASTATITRGGSRGGRNGGRGGNRDYGDRNGGGSRGGSRKPRPRSWIL
ncbi:hypothetical protein DFP72DRAFT_901575, partial [Ephemerocybe angulata]